MTVTFKELFGDTYSDTPLFWTFNTLEFDRVGLGSYVVETPSVLVALHEMWLRSFVGKWVDNQGNTLGDDLTTIIYSYNQQYDTVKCVPLSKRVVDSNYVWTYLWSVPGQTTPILDLPIDINNDAIIIQGSTVMISKATLGNPDTVDALILAFIAYLERKPVSGVVVREGYFVDITTTDTQPFDLDDVEGN